MNASSSYPYTFEEENTCADPLEEVARKRLYQPLSPFGMLLGL